MLSDGIYDMLGTNVEWILALNYKLDIKRLEHRPPAVQTTSHINAIVS